MQQIYLLCCKCKCSASNILSRIGIGLVVFCWGFFLVVFFFVFFLFFCWRGGVVFVNAKNIVKTDRERERERDGEREREREGGRDRQTDKSDNG